MSSFYDVFRRNGNGSIPLYPRTAPPPAPDKLPPHNLEAERSCLGSILLEQGTMKKVLDEKLDTPDFFRDVHQVVFQAMKDLYDEGKEIDGVTLADMLERQEVYDKIGGDELLAEIVESVPHAANARFYARIVREHATARRTMQVAEQILVDGHSRQFNAQELLDRATKLISGVALEPADEEEEIVTPGPWPETMDEPAFHGVAGEIVRRILPLTEADPAALLVQFLISFASSAGHGPHLRIGATRHGVNLFGCIVGRSSRARKGTSWDFIRQIITQADPEWGRRRILSGLSTGEGMIEAVRDARYKRDKVDGAPALGGGGYRDVEIDPGEPDKRALWIESEFGSTLSLKGREGNVLDGIIKKFWETGTVQSSSKANPSRCTDAHVSIIGHVTIKELLRKLSDVDVAGGFANRFLWICSRRTKLLPRPGPFLISDFLDVITDVRHALDGISFRDWSAPMSLSPEAWEAWDPIYHDLGKDRPGILDDMCARAEPLTLRLAAIYAILDCSTRIDLQHLQSALAVWNYSEASVRCIFGEQARDDPDEEKLLAALREAQEHRLDATSIRRQVFKGHKTAGQIGVILGRLVRAGKIVQVAPAERSVPGRPSTVWKLAEICGAAPNAPKAPKLPEGDANPEESMG